MNKLIDAMKVNEPGCHVDKRYIGCIIYAADIILLSASVARLQFVLDICDCSIAFLPVKIQ